MNNHKLKDLPHYISLISIFVAGLLGFYFFSYDRRFQLAVLLSLSISYVAWGIIHHIIHRDICFSIILEYIVVSILGAIMVLSLIYRS